MCQSRVATCSELLCTHKSDAPASPDLAFWLYRIKSRLVLTYARNAMCGKIRTAWGRKGFSENSSRMQRTRKRSKLRTRKSSELRFLSARVDTFDTKSLIRYFERYSISRYVSRDRISMKHCCHVVWKHWLKHCRSFFWFRCPNQQRTEPRHVPTWYSICVFGLKS